MSLQPNVVVTGNAAGKAVIVEDHDIHAVTTPALAGLDLYLAWGTRDGAISNDEDVPSAVLAPYRPGPGGTRLLLVTWLPGGHTGCVERRLPQGTCVVQRGTRHRWVNRTDQPATMAFVLIGSDDAKPSS